MPWQDNLLHGMTVYLYALHDPRNGALRYVGKTVNLRVRYSLHLTETRNTHKNRWLGQLAALGLQPEMRVLEVIENSDDHDWQDKERWWIAAARATGDALTNLDSGGRNGTNKSPETRAKMSAAATGRVMTPESIEKMRTTRRERMDEATREKLRQVNLGTKQTQATKDKRAASLRGQKRSPETRALLSQKAQERETRRRALHPPTPKIKKARAPVTDETRANMRAAHLGKPLALDHRRKLSEAQTKRWSDHEARARLSTTLTGITRSPETRAKMSKAKTGEVHSAERRARNSARRIGSQHTPETIAKMCQQQKARCATPEAREKLRQAAIARWSRKKLTSPA